MRRKIVNKAIFCGSAFRPLPWHAPLSEPMVLEDEFALRWSEKVERPNESLAKKGLPVMIDDGTFRFAK